tara:strand:+ start:10355 stop:11089 length:735 start_codon:yes stop_codon:yes gene_type:complete
MKEKTLDGANIAIVAMGESQLDYHLSICHGNEYDEVWAINAMAGIARQVDRTFMLDPASRFLDTDDSGSQTSLMKKVLKTHPGPIYTCELDERCNNLVEFPLLDVVKDTGSSYLNNTVCFAIAFALYNRVGRLNMFGVDFTYKGNLHFAEAGRACTEFWLSKCITAGMTVSVAPRSGLLDTDVPLKDKVYGYHRLDNPPLIIINSETNEFCEVSYNDYIKAKEEELRNGAIVPVLNTPPEAKRY